MCGWVVVDIYNKILYFYLNELYDNKQQLLVKKLFIVTDLHPPR